MSRLGGTASQSRLLDEIYEKERRRADEDRKLREEQDRIYEEELQRRMREKHDKDEKTRKDRARLEEEEREAQIMREAIEASEREIRDRNEQFLKTVADEIARMDKILFNVNNVNNDNNINDVDNVSNDNNVNNIKSLSWKLKLANGETHVFKNRGVDISTPESVTHSVSAHAINKLGILHRYFKVMRFDNKPITCWEDVHNSTVYFVDS